MTDCCHNELIASLQGQIRRARQIVAGTEDRGVGLECSVCQAQSGLYIACKCGTVLCGAHLHAECADAHEHVLLYEADSGSLLCTRCNEYIEPADTEFQEAHDAHSGLLDGISLKKFADLGQTSYINVVLQIVLNAKEVREYFFGFHHSLSACLIIECPDCFFKRIYSQIFSQEPVDLTQTIYFIYKRTQYHEDFKVRNIMHLHNLVCNVYHPGGVAPEDCACIMHRTFFGALTTIEECTFCQYRQVQTEEFDVISLRMHYSLSVALQEYLLAHLSGPLTYCSACVAPSSVYARHTISSFPRILAIYINRFLDQAECKKNNSRIRIEEEIELQDQKYSLYAFIEHRGSFQGYFMCYILLNNEWYEFNREKIVRDVDISLKLAHAIMVFYRLEHKP